MTRHFTRYVDPRDMRGYLRIWNGHRIRLLCLDTLTRHYLDDLKTGRKRRRLWDQLAAVGWPSGTIK